MIASEKILDSQLPSTIHHFPFDVIKFVGEESVDFLQRITTNDFNGFTPGNIQKTLLVTEKGRMIDTVWVLHRNDYLLMLTSQKMASEIISWLNKYIIMEDIVLSDVSLKFQITVHFEKTENSYQTDYFGFPISIEVNQHSQNESESSLEQFEQWRIDNGIPKTRHELIPDFNPLELNLWNWISFTKGCYVGQEVIARLDTYNKIQRTICKFYSDAPIKEQELLLDEHGSEIGKVTSVFQDQTKFIGLTIVRIKYAVKQKKLRIKDSNGIIEITKVFQKDMYGRN